MRDRRTGDRVMADTSGLKACTYYVVRYVPNVERDESLNIGLFLYCQEERFLDCLFSDDLQRIKRFHPHADLDLLRELQGHFESELQQHENDLAAYLQSIEESYSTLIQLTYPRPVLTTDPQQEVLRLFARYVGERRATLPATDTRVGIKRQLVDALGRARVLAEPRFERRIPAERWTAKGDPFHFDFGYRPLWIAGKPNGHLKLIHALSLARDYELGHVLANTVKYVRSHETADLTSVVEAIPTESQGSAWLTYRLLLDAQISVRPLAEADDYAASIREELRAAPL